MNRKFSIPLWTKVPLLRILLPFVVGIALQWYLKLPIPLIIVLSTLALILFIGYYFLSLARKYTWRWMTGISINLLLFCLGNVMVMAKDIRNHPHWVGKSYQANYPVLVTLQEPLVEKTKSYKALAAVQAIQINGEWKAVKGNILLYFKKDSC